MCLVFFLDGMDTRGGWKKKGPARQVLSVLWKLLYYIATTFVHVIAVKIQCISSFVVCVCVCVNGVMLTKNCTFLGKVNIRLKINEIWKKLKREKLGKDTHTHTQNTKSDLNNITVRVSPTLTTTHSTNRVNENEGEESDLDVWTEFVRGESTTKMLRIIRSRWIENKIDTHTTHTQHSTEFVWTPTAHLI